MIYFIEAVGLDRVKIGYTSGESVERRLLALKTASPVPLKVVGVIEGTQKQERRLHRKYAAHRVCGEWFTVTGELKAYLATFEAPRTARPLFNWPAWLTRYLTTGKDGRPAMLADLSAEVRR
jgi:hypothetical protein